MITVPERQALEKLWRKLQDSIAPSAEDFAVYENHPLVEVRKLADLRKHLKPSMTARTLSDLQIPIERALAKNIRDEHIIQALDRPGVRETLPVRLILNQWRSAFNVGSMFRTAEGLGVEHIHLAGYTPKPDEPKVLKSLMGAAVPWSAHADLSGCLTVCPSFRVVALETTARAAELSTPFIHKPTVFILGNERFGLSSADLDACDEVRKLSLGGVKNSLNVAAIGAIALHEWGRQWKL